MHEPNLQRLISPKGLRIIKTVLIIVISFAAGYFVKHSPPTESSVIEAATDSQQWWTCSMHPQIRQPKPGKCPICFMDLIPVSTETAAAQLGPRQIAFSEEALKLMELQTTPVERKFVETEVRMVGKIDYDETRLKHITAWVPGRVDRLYVDFTGTRVIKGDHMVLLYSPELISAQAEFLQAVEAAKQMQHGVSELIKQSTLRTLEAAREKLILLGLSPQQVSQIENTGKPTDYITINAPMEGIVIEKHISEGAYVKTGTKIYTIADLSQLWVKLDAYESDIVWLRYGQPVEFTTEAYPGQVFKGRITFISPVLDERTRTIKIRANLPNPDGKLKPGMFVRAVVRSKIAGAGLVMDEDISGKWICPMHPSIIKDSAGLCDICQMELVKASSLGYVQPEQRPPLVIPATAPLITGKRAVVYVKLPDTIRPTFEGREVILGPRAADYYIVEAGLKEGEIVVTKGNFKIDSALQIQAKPSMMNPTGLSAPVTSHHSHGQMRKPSGIDSQKAKSETHNH